MKSAAGPTLRRRSARLTAGTAVDAFCATATASEPPGPRQKRSQKNVKDAEDAEAKAAPLMTTKAVRRRLAASLSRHYEDELWEQGFKFVAGVDEAGRGPLAGPVVAAACIIPPHITIDGMNDSKKVPAMEREKLYDIITNHPEIMWAAEAVDAATIDNINILQATMRAMELAVTSLRRSTGAEAALLVDGNRLPAGFDPACSRALVGGDSKSFVIAAASIVAKVTRDRIMDELHQQYPVYDFVQHKGYGVPKHLAALRQHGPCPEHRRTFAPVKSWYPIAKEAPDF